MELPGKRKSGRPGRECVNVVRADMLAVGVTGDDTEDTQRKRKPKIRRDDPKRKQPKKIEEGVRQERKSEGRDGGKE